MSSKNIVMAASGARSSKVYIEDVFSTYLYTGNGSSQTITNGIALANGATNGTILQLSDTLTDLSPVPSSVANVNGGVSVVSSPVKYGSSSFRFLPANNGWLFVEPSRTINIYENFCIEFWQNSASTDETGYVTGTVDNSSNQWQLRSSNGQLRFWIGGSTYINATLPTANQWNHIAFTGDGTTVRLFNNGSLIGSVATSTLVSGGNRLIGATPLLLFGATVGGGSKMDGYMDDIRVISGRSVYTSSFTIPTAALPLDTLVVGKGGLTWIKSRSAATDNQLFDTVRGATKELISNSTAAEATDADTLTTFNSDGFSLGADSNTNTNAATYASWTFRKQPKFFDVVTYTGNGANRTIAHSLGSVPGCIIVKRTDTAADWQVYHRSNANTEYMVLNSTAAKATGTTRWNSTTPTSTVFSIGTDTTVNASGGTYVAYLFAHDAGGFGASGTDNVISCGAFTTDGSGNATVTLGWEPQWLMLKSSSSADNWRIEDILRGLSLTGYSTLIPNLSNAETTSSNTSRTLTATGFSLASQATSTTYSYIAIRRGPMRTPTSGTSVFNPVARTGTGANPTVVTTGNNPDLLMSFLRTASPFDHGMLFWDKMRGVTQMLSSSTSGSEITTSSLTNLQGWLNTGYQAGDDFTEGYLNYNGSTYVNYSITRAPGFFDVVCYTGTGANRTVSHNLGVAPELMIVKKRSAADAWVVYANNDNTDYLVLNTTAATVDDNTIWNDTSPTSSVFTVGTNDDVNGSGATFVAYLFDTVAGVSKVGSYTGNGSSQTINCGFTAGARFVLIKRTDSTGDWYVYDSARGIVAGNDPYLRLNATFAEVTTNDSVDPDNTGFIVNQVAATNINVNTATYIYLAIA